MDIIFSAVLIIAGIGLFAMIGADPAAAASPTELGAAFWPQIILGIMIILSVVNIVTSLKKLKADGKTITSEIDVAGFFKSKLFIGMIAVAILALVLPTIDLYRHVFCSLSVTESCLRQIISLSLQ